MKRVVKFLVSVGFFSVSWVRDAISGLFGKRTAQCVVLYYHSVPESQKIHFERQMDILLKTAEPVAADRKSPLVSGSRCAAVTFDDAFRNILDTALPTMRARKIPATIFVVTGVLGKNWHDTSAESDVDRAVMSEEELKQIPSDLVAIGSHTVTHPLMSQLTPSQARAELVESRRVLERILQRPILLFSFPYGSFSDALIGWAREAGYERVFTTLPELALSDPAEFVTPRVRVDPTDWELEFRLKLLGAYRWLPLAFAMKRKLFPNRIEAATPQQASVTE